MKLDKINIALEIKNMMVFGYFYQLFIIVLVHP